jgi:prepilin-type N-terminal cleavage/methylation domain-containing protein
MKKLTNDRGFTLLEVMIALIVAAIGFLGIAGMITTSIRGNDFSARLTEATNLAQDKIEEMKNVDYRDLYGACDGAAYWGGGDKTICTDPPVTMALDTGQTVMVAANDNGTNGDETAGDGIWTYHYVETLPNAPALNNFDLTWGLQMNFPETGLMRGFSKVTWQDANAKEHEVRLETILSVFSH